MGPEAGVTRAVLDTNVLVSALLFGGRLFPLRNAWRGGRVRLVLCRETVDEFLRVLAYPKFRLSAGEITFLIENEIIPFADVVDISGRVDAYCRDPEDDKFIRCALAGRCRYLVSGDEDLLSLGKVGTLRIVSPEKFLARTGRFSGER